MRALGYFSVLRKWYTCVPLINGQRSLVSFKGFTYTPYFTVISGLAVPRSVVCAPRSLLSYGRGFKTAIPEGYSMAPATLAVQQYVQDFINRHSVAIFSKTTCPFCDKVKSLFKSERVQYIALEIDKLDNAAAIQNVLVEKFGQDTVPSVFIHGKHIGGSEHVDALHENGDLLPMLFQRSHNYEYDLVVIGGGSGGLAGAKEAVRFGAKVAVCDFVKPTPLGTSWGLGGTCVNVGCIPKKLMHQAALLGHELKDSKHFGWDVPDEVGHKWNTMVESIQSHIGSLNWGYRVQLRDKKVEYLNAYATFIDSNTVKTVDCRGKERTLTSDKFILASGGRPRYPDIPGAKEYCITSDDLFSLSYPPGKTLCVGASYISLECASFLAGLGFDVTVMVRSILLRGFDQEMAERTGKFMSEHGVKFIRGAVPTSIEQIRPGSPGTLKVTAVTTEGDTIEDEYNTVIIAIGRDPCTKELGLENTKVRLGKDEKVIVDEKEQSTDPSIYAVGDIREGGLELTPVAIQAGKLFSRRIFGNGSALTDYVNVPTTVFTSLEYGCCGLSEEAAREKYGTRNVEVFHGHFWPLEFTIAHRPENDCYAKLVCVKSDNYRVVGFHYLGPNAGEVTQGFSIGLKLGATKDNFEELIGIHPTCAEVFTTLAVTKSSGRDITVQGC